MLTSSDQEERTRFLARILGPFTVLFSVAIMLRIDEVDQLLMGFFDNAFHAWLAGILLLIAGLVIIALHNHWRGLGAILVSLYGWTLALRGAVVLLVPALVSSLAAALLPNAALLLVGFAAFVVIGLYLSYLGWVVKQD